MNPYNSTMPATETETFVGYQRLVQQLRNGFEDGNSFAILGGRRCGKTSLLLKVHADLGQEGLAHFRALPRYLDIQSLGTTTPSRLFEAIFELVVEGLSTNYWSNPSPGREYDTFLGLLDKAKPLIEKQYGANWLVVLFVDELDAALEVDADGQPINESFFLNLRNLLMVSRFHRHFRLMASGVSELANLISSGSSPLNNLRHKHLGILRTADARNLIRRGFSDSLDPDVEASLFQRTGRHPYLLQGLLERMWEERSSDLTAKSVKTAGSDFLREHHNFDRWVDAFGPTEHAVFCLLANAQEGMLPELQLRQQLPKALIADLDKALTFLSYHGLIDDSILDEPRLTCTLFRDWYQSKHPSSPTSFSGDPSGTTNSAPLSSNSATSQVNVTVNPIINVKGGDATVRVGASLQEVRQFFQDLTGLIDNLDLPDQKKAELRYVLGEGGRELEKPESMGEPNKETIGSSLEKAAGLLQSAETTASAVQQFLEKAEKIAPYVGKAAGWLTTLL